MESWATRPCSLHGCSHPLQSKQNEALLPHLQRYKCCKSREQWQFAKSFFQKCKQFHSNNFCSHLASLGFGKVLVTQSQFRPNESYRVLPGLRKNNMGFMGIQHRAGGWFTSHSLQSKEGEKWLGLAAQLPSTRVAQEGNAWTDALCLSHDAPRTGKRCCHCFLAVVQSHHRLCSPKPWQMVA